MFSLLGIGLSLMSEPVLEPDQLARILRHDCGQHGSDTWPTKEQIATFRQFAPRLGSARVERLMRESVSRADGPQLLSQLIGTLDSIGDLLPRRIASPLDELYLQCQSLLPVDPNPGLQGLQPLRGSGSQAPVRRQARRRDQPPPRVPATTRFRVELPETPTRPVQRQVDPRRRALLAPRTSQPSSSNILASPDPNLTNAIDNVCLEDGLSLQVPRSTAELEAWGRRLGNCLGSYGRAVASGRSLIVGVELHGVLTYCLEVAPNRSIRQFLGIRNRPVPPTHSAIVCTYLASIGVLDRNSAGNTPWLTPVSN